MISIQVYVVYGSRKEINQFVSYLMAMEYSFSHSGEYLYFNYDPTNAIEDAGLSLKAVVENWAINCLNYSEVHNNQ